MTKPGYVEVTSTSSTTADVTPVVLRDGQRKRLVFTPVLVDNGGEPAATVRGELFNCVAALYGFMADTGFEYGTKRLPSVDAGTDLAEILDSISAIGQDQQVKRVLGWMSRQESEQLADALQDAEPEISTRIVIATGLAKLRGFIEEAGAELESADEKHWQGIIERNAWASGQVFSHPLVVVKREAYLGGKSVRNTGGNNADFVLRNQVTGNALIVEMKTPATPLTALAPYRNNAYPPSKELAGAVQQVLQDHYTLRQNYSALAGDKPPDFRVFKPKLLLIVGNLVREDDVDRVRSFELYRNSMPEVEIVTFDELVQKAKLLLDLFEDTA